MTKSVGAALPDEKDMVWIGDYAAHGARRCPDRPALITPELGGHTTFAQFDRQVRRAAAWFCEQGCERGSRVVYYGRNSDVYFAILIAAIRRGIVLVPLNWRCVEPEIAFFVTDSGAQLILCDEEFAAIARSIANSAETDIPVVLTEGKGGLRAVIDGDGPVIDEAIAWDREGICLQLYTSGTTGRPKGVLIRHHGVSVARYQESVSDEFPNWQGGTIVSAMPTFHIGGMSWVLMGLLRGSTIVLTGDASAANLVNLLIEHRAERTFAVPTVIRGIVEEVQRRALTPDWLEGVFYGAAPMSPTLLEDAIATLGCQFGQFFGMTEITGSATFLCPADHDLSRPHLLRSVGKPYPGVEVEIRDAQSAPVSGREPGEIWIKAPSVMREYWNRPDATEEALVDGWYRTGDGGYLDEDGFLYLTDRIKDMIVTGGENVYPIEVEEALRRHPAVGEVAVVGVPHERWGEAIAAIVESTEGAACNPDEIMAFAKTQLAGFKCPKMVSVVPTLPRTTSGKVQRAAARTDLLARLEPKTANAR